MLFPAGFWWNGYCMCVILGIKLVLWVACCFPHCYWAKLWWFSVLVSLGDWFGHVLRLLWHFGCGPHFSIFGPRIWPFSKNYDFGIDLIDVTLWVWFWQRGSVLRQFEKERLQSSDFGSSRDRLIGRLWFTSFRLSPEVWFHVEIDGILGWVDILCLRWFFPVLVMKCWFSGNWKHAAVWCCTLLACDIGLMIAVYFMMLALV